MTHLEVGTTFQDRALQQVDNANTTASFPPTLNDDDGDESETIPFWHNRSVLLLGLFVLGGLWVTLRLVLCTTFPHDGSTVGESVPGDDNSLSDDHDELGKSPPRETPMEQEQQV